MSRESRIGDTCMSAVERRLIELIRESEEAKQITEDFIFGPQISPAAPQAPSDVRETSP